MKRTFIGLVFAVMCFGGLVFGFSSVSALTYSSDVPISFTFNSTIAVQLSSADIYITNLAPGASSDSNIITVGANTNASAGFQLSATVGVKNGTDALVNTNDNTYTFANISTNKATLANFSDNTWGYSYCANTASNCNGGSGTWVSGSVGSTTAGYNGLPLDDNTNANERGNGGVLLISTTGTEGEQKTVQFKIGAKASNAQASGAYTNTINFYAVANPEPMTIYDLTYMQEFATLTASEKGEVIGNMTTGNQYQLKDQRDNKSYYVSKLADGNVWMTQNLDHDIVTTANFYTPANTDISANWTASTATGAITWTGTDTTTPESYDPGNLYWSGTIFDSTPVSSGDAHYHLGNYYNWTAAVAMNSSSSITADNTDVNQSICPAGWMLPKSGNVTTSGSFQYLVEQYGWDNNTYKLANDKDIWESPLYFGLTGRWGFEVEDIGSYADFWSSILHDNNYDSYAYTLATRHDSRIGPDSYSPSGWGNAVRCVVR